MTLGTTSVCRNGDDRRANAFDGGWLSVRIRTGLSERCDGTSGSRRRGWAWGKRIRRSAIVEAVDRSTQ